MYLSKVTKYSYFVTFHHCSWRTNLLLIRSVGNIIGYKKSLSEWQWLSEVKI